MASLPAYKPLTPFLGLIPGGFQPSLMIRMKGKMTSRRGRCTIDFINSAALAIDQDIMFHVSIRMDERVIVRNSYKNKQWDYEDRYGAFRISYHDPFEIVILAEYQHYKIAINGIHLGIFRHRLPLNMVHFVCVKGDIQIEHILFEQDVQSAQEQATLGYLLNNMNSLQPGASYRVGTSTVVRPAGNYMASATTTAVPAYSAPPVYPILPTQAPPDYSHGNVHAATNINDQPPPYHSINPHEQPNQVWLATPFFKVEKQPGRVVVKTSNNESSIRF